MIMKTVWDRDGINTYNEDTKEIPMEQLPSVFIPSVDWYFYPLLQNQSYFLGVGQRLARKHGNCKKRKT